MIFLRIDLIIDFTILLGNTDITAISQVYGMQIMRLQA